MNESQNAFFQKYLERQEEISRKSLAAVATIAQANMDLIMQNGLASIHARQLLQSTMQEQRNQKEDAPDAPEIA